MRSLRRRLLSKIEDFGRGIGGKRRSFLVSPFQKTVDFWDSSAFGYYPKNVVFLEEEACKKNVDFFWRRS
jgi:hypothetical protein